MLNSKILALALVGVNILGLGLYLIKSSRLQAHRPAFDTYSNINNSIKVDINGQVRSPGTYELSEASRVGDAIASAGGVLGTADQVWLAQYINMAQILSDGQKIYIPAISETTSSETKISINAGTKEALISLRGIGEVTADKILASRPFTDINELWERKIMSPRVFEEIKDQISLW